MSATKIGNDAERVAALEARGLLDSPLEPRFENFLSMVAQFFTMSQAAIAIASDSDLVIKASIGLHGVATIPLNGSFTEHALITGERVIVDDARNDPHFHSHPIVTGSPFLRSFAVFPLHAPGGERIGVLALADPQPREFTNPDLANLALIVEWVENELAMERESQRARDIQRALQPRAHLVVPGYSIDGILIASHDVGGDFYDWFGDDSGVTLTLGDVMGKGTGAALLSATLRGAIKSCVTLNLTNIRSHLSTLATAVGPEFAEANAFATLFHAHLHPATGTITYLDAGHGLSIHIDKEGRAARLDANNQPFGINPPQIWSVSTRVLQPGDTLTVVSDGVLDLGLGTLPGLMQDVTELSTIPSLEDGIRRLAERHDAAETFSDDVSVIRIHRLRQD